MTNLLLDTHTFLWAIAEEIRLSPPARKALEDPTNHLLLSDASVWEMAIKTSTGKLELLAPLEKLVFEHGTALGVTILPIATQHAIRVAHLPFRHRDPFDRLLVAQCLEDDLTLVSRDDVLDEYGITRVW